MKLTHIIKSIIIIGVTVIVLSNPSSLQASKKKPVIKNVAVYTQLLRGKTGVNVSLLNTQGASSILYMVSYTTNGKPEGAGGTVYPKNKKSIVRKIIFGTCSSGVCRYHKNVKKVTVSVEITYKNGKTSSKTYKIKI